PPGPTPAARRNGPSQETVTSTGRSPREPLRSSPAPPSETPARRSSAGSVTAPSPASARVSSSAAARPASPRGTSARPDAARESVGGPPSEPTTVTGRPSKAADGRAGPASRLRSPASEVALARQPSTLEPKVATSAPACVARGPAVRPEWVTRPRQDRPSGP